MVKKEIGLQKDEIERLEQLKEFLDSHQGEEIINAAMGKNRIVYVQGVVTQSDLDELKKKSGHGATKDAVNAAIEYYLRRSK